MLARPDDPCPSRRLDNSRAPRRPEVRPARRAWFDIGMWHRINHRGLRARPERRGEGISSTGQIQSRFARPLKAHLDVFRGDSPMKPCPTDLPQTINPEAGPKRTGVEVHRNLNCAHYDHCLDEAVRRGWERCTRGKG